MVSLYLPFGLSTLFSISTFFSVLQTLTYKPAEAPVCCCHSNIHARPLYLEVTPLPSTQWMQWQKYRMLLTGYTMHLIINNLESLTITGKIKGKRRERPRERGRPNCAEIEQHFKMKMKEKLSNTKQVQIKLNIKWCTYNKLMNNQWITTFTLSLKKKKTAFWLKKGEGWGPLRSADAAYSISERKKKKKKLTSAKISKLHHIK